MNDSPRQPDSSPDKSSETPQRQTTAKADRQGSSGSRDSRSDKARQSAMGMNVAMLGMEMGVSVAIMTWLGWWLDNKYDTAPWLTLLGAGIGIGGGLFAMFVQVRRMMPK